MSQYPIVKYKPKIQTNLIFSLGESLDKKTIGKSLFIGIVITLLFCCIYLPFKGIRYNSNTNTNSLSGTNLSGISILESKKEAVASEAPPTPVKQVEVIAPKENKAIPAVNSNFWPKVQLPDLVSPIGKAWNELTQGIGKIETKPAKTSKILDLDVANTSGYGPSNLSVDPFASNAAKIQAVSGKVTWQDGASYTVKSDKFLIKSSLSIQSNNQEQLLTVDNSGLLPADVLLSVNKDTFIKLGGNPTNQSYIDAVVKTR